MAEIPLERTAVYAGPFDPPTKNHRGTARQLAGLYARVIIRPIGPLDGSAAEASLPIHRAVMVDLNFAGLDRVGVDLGELERFPPPLRWERDENPDGPRTYVVSAALLKCGGGGRSTIQTEWSDGAEHWNRSHFTILKMPSEVIAAEDLPTRYVVLDVPEHQPSAAVRLQLVEGNSVDDLLEPRVADYIRRHGLFKATPPARECRHRPTLPRMRLFFDEHSAAALEVSDELQGYVHDDPEMIVSIGGDGTMLRAIRKHWRERLPFYGINVGHLGFLLNDRGERRFWERDLRLYQLPLLRFETVNVEGERRASLAFNDCWLERSAGQTAWIEVDVNGETRMPKVVCDGMLIATAAGSTSYARAMRATPLPFNTPLLTLAGSNVLKPEFWQPAVLTLDSCVTLRNLDPAKRPLRGFVDGVEFGPVTEMTARVSQIAAVELLFTQEHDPVAKLAVLQFPRFT